MSIAFLVAEKFCFATMKCSNIVMMEGWRMVKMLALIILSIF